MKAKLLFCVGLSLLATASSISSCSKEEVINTSIPEELPVLGAISFHENLTWKVSIEAEPAADTRAISVGGNSGRRLYHNWDQDDAVEVLNTSNTSVGTLKADVSEGNSAYAKLDGELTGTYNVGDVITLYYHTANMDYTGQVGTLAGVSTNKSYLTGSSTVKSVDATGGYLSMSGAAFSALQSYVDLTFTEQNGTPLLITSLDVWTDGGKLVKTKAIDGTTVYATEASPLTITPASATSNFFLALRDENGAENNYHFKATTSDSRTLTKEKSLNLEYGHYYYGTWAMTRTVNLSTINSDYTLEDNDVVTGTLASNVKISIAAGATITLNGATINGINSEENYQWAGLSCLGNATIILADGSTNTVKGFHQNYPGIHVPSEHTLTIQGNGSLHASSNGYGAGIGSGSGLSSGNIIISGGNITAVGGGGAAGIGGDYYGECGSITINGGTINATGGDNAPGIGSGYYGNCGDITITNTVTSVTATKGDSAQDSIGAATDGTCGTVTIGGVEGAISESPYTYTPTP